MSSFAEHLEGYRRRRDEYATWNCCAVRIRCLTSFEESGTLAYYDADHSILLNFATLLCVCARLSMCVLIVGEAQSLGFVVATRSKRGFLVMLRSACRAVPTELVRVR